MCGLYILSIRPVYAQAILSGSKKYELRRGSGTGFSRGDIVVMYASGRVKRIVGEFTVEDLVRGPPLKVWRIVTSKKEYGITGESWRYITGSKTAFALKIGSVRPYRSTVSLYEIRDILPYWNPPMGYEAIGKGHPIYELVIKPLREKEGLK